MGGQVWELSSDRIRIESKEEGRLEGEERLGKLICKLIENGCDQSEITRVSTDEAYRKEKYKEYNV